MNFMHDNDQAFELTESELTEVTGTGGFGTVGACGACGLASTVPFVMAFNNLTALNVALNVNLAVGIAHNTALFTQFG